MDRFDQTSPEGLIPRGFGRLEAVEPYMLDRQITVLDDNATDDRRYVDLIFDDPDTAPSDKKAA